MNDRTGLALATALGKLELVEEAKALMVAHDRWAQNSRVQADDVTDEHMEAVAAYERAIVRASYQGLARAASWTRWDEVTVETLRSAADALDSLESVIDWSAPELRDLECSDELRLGGVERLPSDPMEEAARAAARSLASAPLITGDDMNADCAQAGLVETAVLVLRSVLL